MTSRDFVRRNLFTTRWRHRLDRLRKNYVAVKQTPGIVLIMKRFLQGCFSELT